MNTSNHPRESLWARTGISPLMRAVRAMQEVLSSLSKGDITFAGGGVGFEAYKSIIGSTDGPTSRTDINPRSDPEI